MSKQGKSGLQQQLAHLDLNDTTVVKHDSNDKKRLKNKNSNKQPVIKEYGKFMELPGAEMGKVVVRFPPEASGYLHIGHSKAALLNQYYQLAYNGRLIMRFDDTNPAKEKIDFEKVILEDINLLNIKPDRFSYTSDYFDKMLDMCENIMLKNGLAYVDDTDGNKMRLEREQRVESINRNNSIEKNLELWKQMVLGSEIGKKCCVRAKINMQSANGCMRDPTIYRCKPEHHPRTFDKYKVYPTYDFACPIIDSLEGVTHSLRTTEYLDRDEQFYWFCDALQLGTKNNETRPVICSFSRLNMTNTVLSKRKLTWFVEEGHVDGWDDPRMPTVRGVLRRGIQVDALKQFIIAQGSSRTVTAMQWDKIWSLNRSIIDLIAPRHTALFVSNPKNVYICPPVEVLVENVEKPYKLNNVAKHPKNPQLGLKNCVWATPKLLIDYRDSKLLKEGSHATFINWGNLLINRIERNQNDEIKRIYAKFDLENTDFKSTVKLTWLPNINSSDSDETLPTLTPVVCVYFDHLISKPVLDKDDNFKNYLKQPSRWEFQMLGDSELKDLQKGDIIQLQRRGYFICDSSYQPYSIHTGKECPVVLFNIPDGHVKTGMLINIIIEPAKTEAPISQPPDQNKQSVDILISKINDQGNTIRSMKSNNAPKAEIADSVKVLLALKAEYKNLTGTDYTPGIVSISQPPDQNKQSVDILISKINDQGNTVRSMKSNNASKAEIADSVKVLLALKAEYKNLTGTDYTPGIVSISQPPDQNKQSVDILISKINDQGNTVRSMKSNNASKAEIADSVKVLLALKAEYKNLTGTDYTPGIVSISQPPDQNKQSVDILISKINDQGNTVRSMKSNNASKAEIADSVKVLLALKAEYKNLTGTDYTPGIVSISQPPDQNKQSVDILMSKINDQGNTVRSMKSNNASKAEIADSVKVLLALKAEYKNLTGTDYTPGIVSISQPPDQNKQSVDILISKINDQGNTVRSMKSNNASKAEIADSVKVLLALKAEYKNLTGTDFTPTSISQPAKVKPEQDKMSMKSNVESKIKKSINQEKKPVVKINDSGTITKKITKLGLEVPKVSENLGLWYSQVLVKGEMIEYYDVSGCYILRPWAYSIWELVQQWFDSRIKRHPLSVQNCYFPIFVSKAALEKEKDHISDFAPEVAWVTKSGESELAEHIAIRPTSETVMYPAFSKWIQSYRDLPLKLNQWNNVVRWEFKHPQPFLRTREFLWQEGHHAYGTRAEAERDVLITLDYYEYVYKNMLAVPVVKGKKTEKEKFAGGVFTTTCEAFIASSGRAIQGATSHYLGTNFARMFDVNYEHPDTHERLFVHQISYGMTTRTLGVMVMVHGDSRGLVLPPRVATLQVIIVPCGVGLSTPDEIKQNLMRTCLEVCNRLKGNMTEENDGVDDTNVVQKYNSFKIIRADTDLRENYSPGWKFNHWELKGVPLRLELGPKDLDCKQIIAVRRDNGEKITVPLDKHESGTDKLVSRITELLNEIQNDMLAKAQLELEQNIKIVRQWPECAINLAKKHLLLIPFCGNPNCEDNIKRDTTKEDGTAEIGSSVMGAKSLCVPFEQPEGKDKLKSDDNCIHPQCGQLASSFTLFGRSY